MTFDELLQELDARSIKLRSEGEDLIVYDNAEVLDAPLVDALRTHKAALLELAAGAEAPPRITPDLLPLATLTQEDIDRVIATVPGGAANAQDIYALTPLQEGILFHHLMTDLGDPYLLVWMFSFDSRERLDRYLAALQAVVARHDILRTSVVWEGLSEPVQVVWRQAPLAVMEVECDPAAGDVAQQLLDRFNPRRHRIDLRQAPLLRLQVAYDPANTRWLLLELQHHLIGDHSTQDVLLEEIEGHLLGRAEHLPAPVPFRNLVAQARLGISREAHEAFFRRLLGDVDTPTAPFGLLNVQGNSADPAEAHRRVDPVLAHRLRSNARRLGVSTATLCHLAWALVLARVSGGDDVVFGTVLFGRMHGGEGIDRMMGLSLNTLPVRIRIGDGGIEACVRDVQILLADLLRHEHAPLALAQRCSAVPAPTPLFSALLNYRHSPGWSESSPWNQQAWTGMQPLYSEERTNYPLVLSIDDLGQDFDLTVQSQPPAEPGRVCELMHTALDRLVSALESTPHASLLNLDVLPADEYRQVVEEFNGPAAPYPDHLCLHQLFEQQAARTPDAVALVYADHALSYAELNRRANRLAHHLLQRGVQPDQRIALCLERSPELVVALLAVLKAGAAYVPLDPDYPAERLAYLFDDSAPRLLLSQQHLLPRLAALGGNPPLLVDADAAAWADLPDTNPVVPSLTSRHLAYVIYTSGSTGRPKGVMVEHANVARLFAATQDWFHFGTEDVWSLFHSYAFDFSVWEIWGALLHGGRLVVVPRETTRSPEDFYRLVCRAGVTVLNQTPTAFRQFIAAQAQCQEDTRLRLVIFGGEALDVALLKPWYARNGEQTQLVNMYGITETTVHVTYRPLTPADAAGYGSPIGRPIPDLRLYLLDHRRQPVPIGVAGEIHVGGAGLARGYLNRPELTAERFLPDPFSTNPADRLYKTGDLARWRPDGALEFLGRNDHQVKIRGFRIELGEIEACLAGCPAVRDAVVLAREDLPGDRRLVAYYLPATADAGPELLRAHLAAALPEHMLPAAYVALDAFPLTVNGKLDRQALPAPDAGAFAARTYAAPQGPLESTLAALWAELLALPRVGRHDNFFELGGHSLLAVSLIARMRRQGLHADVRTLFTASTLAALAATVDHRPSLPAVPPPRIPADARAITPDLLPLVTLTQEEIDGIVATVPGGPANLQDIYPLAPLQEGILFHYLMAQQGDPYLLFSLTAFDSRERLERYLAALQAVIARHDILRTSFVWQRLAEPVQVVWREAPLAITEITCDPALGDVAGQLQARFDPQHHRLNLQQAPLLQVCLTHDREHNRWLLLQIQHHLISDHTSLAILYKEAQMQLLGRAGQLPAPVPFRNLVAQSRRAVSRAEHEAFFRRLLGDVDEPTAPFGLLNVQGDGSDVLEARRPVQPALARRLRDHARRLGVSAATLCHLAWALVLARVSGRNDVVFGTVLFGRMHGGEGIDQVVGLFINTLPMRIRVDDTGVEAGVRKVHTLLADLLRHEHASLALAQRCSAVAAPTPLFSALLNYRHATGEGQTAPESREAWAGVEHLNVRTRTNYPFVLSIDDQGRDFELVTQAAAFIDPMRICACMHTALEQLATALESAPHAPLHTLDVLPLEERQQVVQAFNDTAAAYPAGQCLHQLFEAQAARAPDAVALVAKEQSLTYGELDRQANRLAHRLRQLGVGPGQLVGICLERSPLMVTAVLAVLKAGGAYVPLDPAYPQDRIAAMLDDARPGLLLTQLALTESVPAHGARVFCLDVEAAAIDQEPATAPPGAARPDDLAYVTYTSGSTGRPKGVMTTHRSAVNYLAFIMREYAVTPQDRVLQIPTLSFDASVRDICGTLAAGARLQLLPPANSWDPEQAGRLIRDAGITALLSITPSFLEAITSAQPEGTATVSRLRLVLASGEVLARSQVDAVHRVFGPTVRVVNQYGPTECTMTSTYFDTTGADAVLIGKPIANAEAYVLDTRMRPMPVGAVGEIHIGGIGLARGYLHRPELTDERFVPHPFRPGERLYRTGDLGRWLPCGNLEYLGRLDNQIKIRGVRIEPGEIEHCLRQHPSVRETLVLAREDEPGDQRLVAYVVCQPGEDVDAGALRLHARAALPHSLVPRAFVMLPALPLSPNGKVDRKALPAPPRQQAGDRYVAPRTAAESALAGIFADVLGAERVGITDDFFELGGDSILLMQVISRAERAGLHVAARQIFDHPTVAELASAVRPLHLPAAGPAAAAQPVNFAAMPASHKPLVVIKFGARELAPVFCMPGSGAQIVYFNALAHHLGERTPVYGMQPRGYVPGTLPHTSVEEMADAFVEALLPLKIEQPLRLVGHSFGGWVTFEMALRLEALGVPLATVMLLDPPLMNYVRDYLRADSVDITLAIAQFLEGRHNKPFGLERADLAGLSIDEQVEILRQKMMAGGILSPRTPFAVLRASFNVISAHLNINYQPSRVYSGPVLMLRPKALFEEQLADDLDPARGWIRYAPGLVHQLAPGGHLSMVEEPYVRDLAAMLNQAWTTVPEASRAEVDA